MWNADVVREILTQLELTEHQLKRTITLARKGCLLATSKMVCVNIIDVVAVLVCLVFSTEICVCLWDLAMRHTCKANKNFFTALIMPIPIKLVRLLSLRSGVVNANNFNY